MPRAKRYLVEGHTYHLTHRCHDRRFLLRFARDRDAYREWLRQGVRRYRVPVFGYSITSNHVHLVIHVDDREAVGRLVDLVAGATARQYNRRKGRSGAFWEDSYHATAVESGTHGQVVPYCNAAVQKGRFGRRAAPSASRPSPHSRMLRSWYLWGSTPLRSYAVNRQGIALASLSKLCKYLSGS